MKIVKLCGTDSWHICDFLWWRIEGVERKGRLEDGGVGGAKEICVKSGRGESIGRGGEGSLLHVEFFSNLPKKPPPYFFNHTPKYELPFQTVDGKKNKLLWNNLNWIKKIDLVWKRWTGWKKIIPTTKLNHNKYILQYMKMYTNFSSHLNFS